MITMNEELELNLRERAPAFYMASLFVPREERDGFRIIMAFLMEMEHVIALSTNPMMSAIRFTWWAEQLEAMPDGRIERHPLNEGLLELVKRNEAVRAPLLAMTHAAHDALDHAENAFMFRDHRINLWSNAVAAYVAMSDIELDGSQSRLIGGLLFEHMMSEQDVEAKARATLPDIYTPLWLVLAHKGKRGPVGPLSLLKMLWVAARGRL